MLNEGLDMESRFRWIADSNLTMLGIDVGEDYLPKDTPSGAPVHFVDASKMLRFSDDKRRIIEAWPIVPFASKSREEWESIATTVLENCQTPALREVRPAVLVDHLKNALPFQI